MAAPTGTGHRVPCPRCLGGRLFWDGHEQEWACLNCAYRPAPKPLRDWDACRYSQIEPKLPIARVDSEPHPPATLH